ncbi:MAG: tRNA (adenosine(37)-N6)-threonylcarbamoyltransferase complex ATPase subunit type 1 TsaE [Sphingosinicella sp.]|nr:tRNA (adenosine(37)-N6)-threonylcarbamoyltransferase complex ATPase subunit type 1 TsaE [Sphingosinicella sp.]
MLLAGEEATEGLGHALGEQLRVGDVIALFGDLGAGKTTFSRGVLSALGFQGEVTSPTFPIVQPYEVAGMRLPLWHVDLYRLEEAEDIEQLALDEARMDAALVIEWPGRMGAALWSDALRLTLSVAGEGVRSLTAEVPPAWEGRWPL